MSTTLLDKILAEIGRREQEITALQAELEDLNRTASILSQIPERSRIDLDTVARVLRRFVAEPQEQSDLATPPPSRPESNGVHKTAPIATKRERDLFRKTIVECATKILGEHQGQSIHYRDLMKEAVDRGYHGRVSSTPEQVERSWIQTLRKVALEGGPVEKTGEGLFRLRAKARAEEG